MQEKKWNPPSSRNKEGASSWGSELEPVTAVPRDRVAGLSPGKWGAGLWCPARGRAPGLGPAGDGELSLRSLHEAGASKVSTGCTFTESVAWKKIHPPIQADNMELLSYGETKLLYSEFHWQSHVYTIVLFVSIKQTQTSKISINLHMHEKKKKDWKDTGVAQPVTLLMIFLMIITSTQGKGGRELSLLILFTVFTINLFYHLNSFHHRFLLYGKNPDFWNMDNVKK